ncbi:hypothetical protein [Sphingomonas flavescens]|uniref:hypothetical protein n=1 Tax=Sphingomonas flavescens TaxID=3132797 RepID=UPI00280542C4|nr:hypothetical protein [Sphingomonas limnosediminicola]
MKAYVVRPSIEVFDGSGTLSADADRALRVIAEMVADCLQQGDDTSHHAAVWEGSTQVATPPKVIALPDRPSLVALALRLLDPNELLGGDVRSTVNCRAATFGQDGQAMLCLRHEDATPTTPKDALVSVADCSEHLAGTDLFDGGWPSV